MSHRIKNLIRLAISLIFVAIIGHILIQSFVGRVQYQESFKNSEYIRATDNRSMLKTDWADIETTRRWVNVVLFPDCPAFTGYLISTAGVLRYEYGMFVADYETEHHTVNGKIIQLVEEEDKLGIHVPVQGDMIWGLTFFPSKFGNEHRDELVKMTTRIRFRPLNNGG